MQRTLTAAGRFAQPNPSQAPSAESLVGTCLGDRYRLLKVLGEGGMGCVFQAERLPAQKTVALKLLLPEFATVDHVIRRFERETEVASRLRHPNIVKVLDSGQAGGQLFLAMEMLDGKSLADLIESGERARQRGIGRVFNLFKRRSRSVGTQLSVTRAIAIMSQVLAALKHAHSLGIVHRDLKPENIMLIQGRGPFGRETVKLLDFGIAKLTEPEAHSQKLTQLGVAVGTPRYMSPEQAMGQEADARSDLYSCGVILYEMLTGRRPFEAESNLEILSMHMTAAPKAPRLVAPEAHIPAAIERVVLRALAKIPKERFQSAAEFRKALERAVRAREEDEPISGVEPTLLAAGNVQSSTRVRWGRAAVRWLVVGAAAAVIADHHMAAKTTHGTRAVSTARDSGAGSGSPQRGEPVNRPASAAARVVPKTLRSSGSPIRTPAKPSKPRSH